MASDAATSGAHPVNTRESRQLNASRQLAMRLVALLFVGCTSSHQVDNPADNDAGHVVSDPAPPMETAGPGLCARLAGIQCSAEERCCESPARSLESCLRDRTQDCQQSAYLDRIATSPGSGFDPSLADRAFDALEQRTSMCDPELASWAISSEGLRRIFAGTLELDESCTPVGGASADPGIVASALSACRIADGLACLPKGLLGEWTCAPKQTTGQTCVTDDNCQSDSICNNAGQAALGSCVSRLPLGAACTDANQCDSLGCTEERCSEPDVQTVYCPAA